MDIFSTIQGFPKQRAKAGVRCIIHENLAELITDWNSVSERIMTVIVKLNKDQEEGTQIIVTYAPTEDALVEEKDSFFELLQKVIDDHAGNIIILGDLNGRVHKQSEKYNRCIGIHGEDVLNDIGGRLIEIYMVNDLIITNTKFSHKWVHKIT
jgi:transcriptional regulator with PAS, ATPase and Fis domain